MNKFVITVYDNFTETKIDLVFFGDSEAEAVEKAKGFCADALKTPEQKRQKPDAEFEILEVRGV